MHDEPLPDAQDGEEPSADEPRSGFSLTDDLVALIDDGKTYVEAEAAFQKSRALFVANKGKKAVIHGLVAFAMIHTALIGLVVGAVIALSPILTIWGATALVSGLLIVVGVVLARKALGHLKDAGESFGDD
ncbi:phage holin family protein [Pelagerythrobacter sp.]|uniref:phage holin family protein n=1 Tax=Pelagerythrobacter sp. TaxID=2800702 RepID=UPI0035B4F1B7